MFDLDQNVKTLIFSCQGIPDLSWSKMLFSLPLTVWSLTLYLSLDLQLVDCSDFAEDLAQCAAEEPLNKCLVKVSGELNLPANWCHGSPGLVMKHLTVHRTSHL